MRTLRTVLGVVGVVGVVGSVGLAALAGRADAGALDEGKAHAAAKRWPEAAAAYEKALASSPREAAIGLAGAAAEGRLADVYDRAQEALRTALRAKPADRDLRLALAGLYFARSADDPRWHADVEEQYRKVLEANPGDEDATAGLGRMHLARADHVRGLAVLDAFLAKSPRSAKANRWKGEILYDQAVLAYREAGKLSDAARGLFERALGALRAATEADPSSFDAWLKRGYSEQYLGLVKEAGESYEKAVAADGESDLPVKGLAAITPKDEWPTRLGKLAAAHPAAPMVLYFHAWEALQADRTDEAEKALRQHLKVARRKGDGQYLLGTVLEKKGDGEGAKKAFLSTLEENPGHDLAVEALEVPLRAQLRDAGRDVVKLRPLVAEYRKVAEAAPRNVNVRNNLGFILREAYGPGGRGGGGARWILDESVKAYEEAVALIGEWREEHAATVPYPRRHGYAQVLNDTGLMFHYYPEIQDLAKAEALYRRAQEWTDHGYWDAYGNLLKILEKQERWQEALEYAEACAEGLKDESGEPNATFRATARGDAERLRKRVTK